MNKLALILIVAAMLLGSTNIWAADFEYGFKVGLPVTSVHLSNLPDNHISANRPTLWLQAYKSKLGIDVSFKMGYYLGNKVYLGVEPGFIRKGAHFENTDSQLDLFYWKLPILLGYQLTDHLRLCAGPEISYLSKATVNYRWLTLNLLEVYDRNENSIFVGFEYRANRLLSLGLRSSYGLTKATEVIWTDEEGHLDAATEERNRYVMLYATLTIR